MTAREHGGESRGCPTSATSYSRGSLPTAQASKWRRPETRALHAPPVARDLQNPISEEVCPAPSETIQRDVSALGLKGGNHRTAVAGACGGRVA
jgi:hypothetical protein